MKSSLAPAGRVAFLGELLGRLRGRVIVVWDGGSNHTGPLIRALVARYPRLHLERLPAYAPDYNPEEMLWGYLKRGRLANFVPRHVRRLDRVVAGEMEEARVRPGLLKALWAGPKLPFIDRSLFS